MRQVTHQVATTPRVLDPPLLEVKLIELQKGFPLPTIPDPKTLTMTLKTKNQVSTVQQPELEQNTIDKQKEVHRMSLLVKGNQVMCTLLVDPRREKGKIVLRQDIIVLSTK